MIVFLLLISMFASIIGAICGIGGGVIIKPLVDALGIMTVTEVSFLSGCTVLAMSLISNYKYSKDKTIKVNIFRSGLLAIGAVAGGIFGKFFFQYFKQIFQNDTKVGYIQSWILLILLILTLIYTYKSKNIKKNNIQNKGFTITLGILLGILSSFLGIGGGPFNLVILEYFFSMDTKEAARNSIYIIMFSQISALVQTLVSGTVPKTNLLFSLGMIFGGILGGYIGSSISRRLSNERVGLLFKILLLLLIGISIYNIIRFA